MDRVAEASGIGIFRDDSSFVVVNMRTTGLQIATFVIGLVGIILVVNGVVMLGPLASDVPLPVGLTILGLGCLCGAGAVFMVRTINARRSNIAGAEVLVVLDFASNRLLDSAGHPLAALVDVRQRTTFQIASSARRLLLVTPTGEIPIARGNGLAGGLGRLPVVLAELGIERIK